MPADLHTKVAEQGIEGQGVASGARLAGGQVLACEMMTVGISSRRAIAPRPESGAIAGNFAGIAARGAYPAFRSPGRLAARGEVYALNDNAQGKNLVERGIVDDPDRRSGTRVLSKNCGKVDELP